MPQLRNPRRRFPLMYWVDIPLAIQQEAIAEGLARQAAVGDHSTPRLDLNDPSAENRFGYITEWAFAKWKGHPPPTPWMGYEGDPGYDFRIRPSRLFQQPGVGTVDVKGPRKMPWCVSVKVHTLFKPEAAAVYMVAWAQPTRVGFFRWATHEQVRKGPKKHWGNTGADTRIVHVDECEPWHSL